MSEFRRTADPTSEGWVPGELNQAFVRLAIVGSLTLYTGITTLTEPGEHSRLWFIAPVVYLFWSTALLAWAYWFCRPDSPRWSRLGQRIVCMISDYGALSFGVSQGGAAGAPLYPIYLWITFGNGIRYGVRYLALSTAIGLVSFAWLLLVTPYWRQNWATGIGLLLGLAVLPAYVAQLLKRLTTTLAAVQEANEVKSRFIANMSHELRTPLHGVIAVADLMEQQDLRRESREMLRMIQSSARAQLGLVNRILDVSRLAAGEITLAREAFRLIDVLRDSDDIIRPQARAKGLAMQLAVDPRLATGFIGSPEHLRQVLVNLLGNAVKFTDTGVVALRVALLQTEGERQRLRFTVSDTGVGIPREAQTRIFKPFVQADTSVTRRYGGTGLGVSISQELVRLMGSDIRLASQPGHGSVFSFELCLPVAPEPADAERALGGLNVWALGFPPERTVARSLLGYAGVQVLDVPSVEALVEGAPLGVYGHAVALLVDAASGRLDTAAVARALRAEPCLERLPLVAVDCGPQRQDLLEAGYTLLLPDVLDPAPLFRAVAIARELHGEPERGAPQAGPAARPLSVLVADDHPTNRAVMRMVLEQAGHRVDLAEDGPQALGALNEGTHDLALIDMHMPGMSGAQVVREHRLMRGELATPVILVTADTTEDARTEALGAGVEAVLIKPIRPAELRAAVEQAAAHGHDVRTTAAHHGEPALRGVPAPALLDERVLEELAAVASGPRVIAQLLEGFIEDGERSLAGMHAALEAGRYAEFYDLAHGLKGSAHNVGANALSERLGALERLEIWQLGADGRQLLELAGETFTRTEAALREFARQREASHG